MSIVARQELHWLDGLGSITAPQVQQGMSEVVNLPLVLMLGGGEKRKEEGRGSS